MLCYNLRPPRPPIFPIFFIGSYKTPILRFISYIWLNCFAKMPMNKICFWVIFAVKGSQPVRNSEDALNVGYLYQMPIMILLTWWGEEDVLLIQDAPTFKVSWILAWTAGKPWYIFVEVVDGILCTYGR